MEREKQAAYARDALNVQASVIVDTQTEIKQIIKNGVLSGMPFFVISKKIRVLIDKSIRKISSPTLKKDAESSFLRFSNLNYQRLKATINVPNPNVLAAVLVLSKAIWKSGKKDFYVPKSISETKAVEVLKRHSDLTFRVSDRGVPLQEFSKIYMDRVSTALKELSQSQAMDPGDVSGRNSLRNLAEMQVRYEKHLQEIQDFKTSGIQLVVASVHADCSSRCAPWQGRVYSLDGTSGTTEDGRQYIPLEVATEGPDAIYKTKKGRIYKNGLLGFNCRHKLLPYKVGMGIPSISEEERKKEDYITKRQRELERAVIKYREEALSYKGIDLQKYKQSRMNALKTFEKYKDFSRSNNRAFYPDRVKVL